MTSTHREPGFVYSTNPAESILDRSSRSVLETGRRVGRRDRPPLQPRPPPDLPPRALPPIRNSRPAALHRPGILLHDRPFRPQGIRVLDRRRARPEIPSPLLRRRRPSLPTLLPQDRRQSSSFHRTIRFPFRKIRLHVRKIRFRVWFRFLLVKVGDLRVVVHVPSGTPSHFTLFILRVSDRDFRYGSR